MSNWMSPFNKVTWIKAFRAKQTKVTLDDGRKFNLDYKSRSGQVLVTPADPKAFVPRGTFELKEVTHSAWLETHER